MPHAANEISRWTSRRAKDRDAVSAGQIHRGSPVGAADALNRRLGGGFPTDAGTVVRLGVANCDALTVQDVLTLIGEIEWAKIEIRFRDQALVQRARELGLSGDEIQQARVPSEMSRVTKRWHWPLSRKHSRATT